MASRRILAPMPLAGRGSQSAGRRRQTAAFPVLWLDPGAVPERELRLRLAALRLDRETMIGVFNWDPEVQGY